MRPCRAAAIGASVVLAGSLAQAQNVEFKGKIAKSYQESREWWPEPIRPPEGAPNVIIFLLDDVGFAQIGCFRHTSVQAL